MKRLRPLVVLSAVLLVSILQMRVVYAASIGFTTYNFMPDTIYQGDSNAYVDLEVKNDANSSIELHGALVHFDWQDLNESFLIGSQKGGEPWDLGKILEPAEAYILRIPFSVPTSVSEGGHSFFFKVFYDDGSEAQWNPRAQDPYAELAVYNMYEPVYENLVFSVEDKVMGAWNAGFISPGAMSLRQRADNYLYEAYDYADEGKWQNAVSRLQAASRYIDDAYEAEQTFRTYLIIGGLVGIGAVIAAGLFIFRRRKQSAQSINKKAAKQS